MGLVEWKKGESHYKSSEAPVSVQRGQKRKERQQKLDEAYAICDKRDQNKCRVTGKALTPSAIDPAHRREHHHLVERSRSRARREDPTNICLVSALVHKLISVGWIACEGTNADAPLFWHWTKLATSKPIVIKRWNPREKD